MPALGTVCLHATQQHSPAPAGGGVMEAPARARGRTKGTERAMAVDAKQYALDKHREWEGKIEVVSRASITTLASSPWHPRLASPSLA